MRPIRYIEHPNTVAYITPFVGKQVAISEAFNFDIPEGCAPEYVVRKTNKGKRGRPRKNKQVVKEESETLTRLPVGRGVFSTNRIKIQMK